MLKTLPTITSVEERRRKLLFLTILIPALLVVTARCLSPFEVGKDQALQLEAALRLVHGKGLTCTYNLSMPPDDISQLPVAKVLTWWPPIFSLMVVALLKTDLPLTLTLKLIYAAVSIIGWVGWGLIATIFLAIPLEVGGKKFYLGFLIAALSPVYFTLSWGGTDIILWAGIPYLIILLNKSSYGSRQYLALAIAGTLFGILYGVRYASSFLGLASLLTLFAINLPSYKTILKKSAVFLLFGFLAALPVVLFVRVFSEQGRPLPEYVDASYGVSRLGESLHRNFNYLPVISNSVFCMPLLEELILYRTNSNWLHYIFGLACLGILLAIPIIFFKLQRQMKDRSAVHLALSLSFLPLSLVALLVTMVFVTDQLMIEVSRYHEPIRLSTIMLYYGLASMLSLPRVIKHICLIFLLSFLFYICFYLPIRALRPVKRDDIVRFVFGFTPARSLLHTSTSQSLGFPSNMIYSLKENTRAKLRELHQKFPEAIFFADNYPFYVYDDCALGRPCPGNELRKLPDDRFWQKAYTSRGLKVFWVLNRPSDLPAVVPETNRKLIHTDPFEKTYIFESDFPAGYKFTDYR